MLIAGGAVGLSFGAFTATAELYTPGSGWSSAAPMLSNRAFHTATLLTDGRVLVTGGASDGAHFLSSAEVYHPSSNTWTPAASMQSPRWRHTAVLLPTGEVLVVSATMLALCAA